MVVSIKKSFLMLIACASMSGMYASQPQKMVSNQWPDGRESFQDLAESKPESVVKALVYPKLKPDQGEVLTSEIKVSPHAVFLADRLRVKAPKRLRSIIDDAPAAFKAIPNDIWKKYICPAIDAHAAVFPIEISNSSQKEVVSLGKRLSDSFTNFLGEMEQLRQSIIDSNFDGVNQAVVSTEDGKWLAILEQASGVSYIYVIDVKTQKICARISGIKTLASGSLYIDRYPQFSIHAYTQLSNLRKCWQRFDLSTLEDPAVRRIIEGQLTLEQSMLLGYLVDIEQKNNKEFTFTNRSISLLKDIAHPRVLVLRELQAILASFPPEIQEAIIKKFNIVDATEKDALAQIVKREKHTELMKQVKHLGTAAAIAFGAVAAATLHERL